MSSEEPHTLDFPRGLPQLEGSLARLRQIVPGDAGDLLAIFSDPEVTRYWGGPALTSLEDAHSLVREIGEAVSQRRFLQWGITPASQPTLIGTCTLFALSDQHRRAELGFALARPYWGRGLATDAVRTLVRFAFQGMNLHRLEADTDPRNLASQHLLLRLGFRKEGYLRERYLVADERQDAVFFGLLREEWNVAT